VANENSNIITARNLAMSAEANSSSNSGVYLAEIEMMPTDQGHEVVTMRMGARIKVVVGLLNAIQSKRPPG